MYRIIPFKVPAWEPVISFVSKALMVLKKNNILNTQKVQEKLELSTIYAWKYRSVHWR